MEGDITGERREKWIEEANEHGNVGGREAGGGVPDTKAS